MLFPKWDNYPAFHELFQIILEKKPKQLGKVWPSSRQLRDGFYNRNGQPVLRTADASTTTISNKH